VPGTAGLFRSENWLRTTHLFPPLENFPFWLAASSPGELHSLFHRD
jgi:hypothetical protein